MTEIIKNVSIVGAGGAIGRSLSEFLIRRSRCNLILNYKSEKVVPSWVYHHKNRIKVVCGDIVDKRVLNSVLLGSQILIHLASTVSPSGYSGDWSLAYKYGVDSTFAILDYLKSYKKKIHIVFPSSGGTVYSGKQQINYKESDETQGISPYGIQKIMFENYLKLLVEANSNISCSVLRIANPYGVLLKDSRKQGLIDTIASLIQKKEKIKIWSSLETVRDYIFIDDLNEAFLAAMNYESDFDIFNIGSGVGTSIQKIIEIFQECSDLCVDYVQVVSNNVGYYPVYNVLNIEKAFRVLKWRPSVNIRDGIRKVMERTVLRDNNEANK